LCPELIGAEPHVDLAVEGAVNGAGGGCFHELDPLLGGERARQFDANFDPIGLAKR
jgi:hypothetical protein